MDDIEKLKLLYPVEKNEMYRNLESAIAIVDTHRALYWGFGIEDDIIIASLRKAIVQVGRVSVLENQIDLLHQEIADLKSKSRPIEVDDGYDETAPEVCGVTPSDRR